MSRTKLLVLVVVVAAFAGCFRGPQEAPPVASSGPVTLPPDFVDPMILDHDHSDAALHDLSWRMKELYHHPLGGTNLKSSGAHVVDIQNGWLFVAAYGAAADVSGGVYIFDLRNPEEPQFHAHLPMLGNVGGDRSMEVTDDANWIVLGTESQDCAGHVNPFGPGLYLIDFRDKEAGPSIADYFPSQGYHSITVHRVEGADYVFTTAGTYGQNIFRIDVAGVKPRLVPVGAVPIQHDAAAYDDPVLGIPLLYVANVADLTVYDISDANAPKLLGKWSLTREEFANHYVHAIAMDMVEGRRILTLESEDWRGNPSPLWVLDATDIGAIERIGNWTNPGQKAANAGVAGGGVAPVTSYNGQLIFSTHNPRLENGLVYLSHYHGGLWVLNVSTYAQAEAPEMLGYFLPHNDNGGFVPRSSEGTYPKPNVRCGFELTQVPIVFDAEVQDGIAYIADMHTGLYVVTLDTASAVRAN